MTLTISVLEGLLLLLPGLTALGAWNFLGSTRTARRPELPLTAVNALVVAMLVALIIHLCGIGLCALVVAGSAEWTANGLPALLPPLDNPYAGAVRLLGDHPEAARGKDFFAFLIVILFECLVVARIVSSRGVAVAFAGQDLRGVGWAYKHFTQPLAHGYVPIAFAMLKAVEKGCGIGYIGPIEDLRLGAEGEMTSISLGQPQRFTYQVSAGDLGGAVVGSKILRRARGIPDFQMHDPKWVGGVVHLMARDIHNLVVHTIPETDLAAFLAAKKL